MHTELYPDLDNVANSQIGKFLGFLALEGYKELVWETLALIVFD